MNKSDLHSVDVSCVNDAIRWRMFFFQSTFEANEMFFLLKNLLFLLIRSQFLK